ncbi:MAG TPA: low-specificity L-threonine aldolase [Oceanospirillaceae bacterium]|nr:low-specificity L-threonine aldolase [Oceanospirillaceae bacterium]
MSGFHYGDGPAAGAKQLIADLRSDTVTRPCPAMLAVMAAAEVGDDVYGDDPNVNALEAEAAQRLGKAAALFLPTGTMSNLTAVMAHCQRGEEIIIGDQYHIAIDEACGASVLGSVAIHALPVDARGAITPAQVQAAIKPDDSHFAISKLVCLENTVHGQVQDQANIDAVAATAKAAGLSVHLDGARLFNAAVAQGKDAKDLVANVDSVSICLSKGLGTPMGSVLVADELIIRRARRLRKMLGGGMRQVGIVAAAGRYALDNNIQRLADDHRRARFLAASLQGLAGLEVDLARVETNMLFLSAPRMVELGAYLAEQGFLLSAFSENCRIVLHKDVSDAAVEQLVELIQGFFA